MSENYQQFDKCVVINDKSQGSITKHLRCDVLFYYKFIIQFAGERIFKTGEYLAKLRTRLWCLVFLIIIIITLLVNTVDKTQP